MSQEVIDHLERAKQILHDKGWMKGIGDSPDGPTCALGALAESYDIEWQDGYRSTDLACLHLQQVDSVAVQALAYATGSLFDEPYNCIYGHNDLPDMDYEKVIQWFDKAIESFKVAK